MRVGPVLSLLVGLALLALVGAGCGLPANAEARAIPAGQVPFGLLRTGPPRAAPMAASPIQALAQVFLVRQGRLVAVGRVVDAPLSVKVVLDALLAAPSNSEAAAGLRSAVNEQASLLSARIRGGVADLDLTSAFAEVGGQDQILAVAQVVYTATSVPGVTAVTFALDGKPVEVPGGDGTLLHGPVTRANFPALASR